MQGCEFVLGVPRKRLPDVLCQLEGNNICGVGLEVQRVNCVQRRRLGRAAAEGLLDQMKRQLMQLCPVAG